ncbi:hypothetical protein BLOT_014818 [Blomia tropicalis]|nr:hypothetical protein BLOT_014818 [Blomia tropicalis]
MSESNKDTSEGYDFSDLSIDDTINIDDNAAINPISNCVLINWKSIHESIGKNKTFSIDMNKFPFQQVYVLNSSKKLLLDISKWQNYEDIGDDYNRELTKLVIRLQPELSIWERLEPSLRLWLTIFPNRKQKSTSGSGDEIPR